MQKVLIALASLAILVSGAWVLAEETAALRMTTVMARVEIYSRPSRP
jgi:hypothetical protein